MRRSTAIDSAFDSSVGPDTDPPSWSSLSSTDRSVSAGATASSHPLTSVKVDESLDHGLITPSLTDTSPQVASALLKNATAHGASSTSLTTVRSAVTLISAPDLLNLARERKTSTNLTSKRLGLEVANSSSMQLSSALALTKPASPSVIPPTKSRRKVI